MSAPKDQQGHSLSFSNNEGIHRLVPLTIAWGPVTPWGWLFSLGTALMTRRPWTYGANINSWGLSPMAGPSCVHQSPGHMVSLLHTRAF